MDSCAWLVQSRIIAACQKYLVQHKKEKDVVQPSPNVKTTNFQKLEKLGHIVCKGRKAGRDCCSVCGQEWARTSGATRRILSLGDCPARELGATSLWAHMIGSQCTFNGHPIHCSHVLGWTRGILFCYECGYYASSEVVHLTKTCPLKPPSVMQARIRNGLLKGVHTTGGRWPMAVDAEPPVSLSAHLSGGLEEVAMSLEID